MLVDAAAEDWDVLMETVEEDTPYTLDNFKIWLSKFIALYFQPSDRSDAIDWMKALQHKDKPEGMSLFRVMNRLKTLVLDYTAIPSPGNETLTDNDIKKIIYDMASNHEQAVIQRKYNGPTGCTLEELKDCLNTEERVRAIYDTSSNDSQEPPTNNDNTEDKDNSSDSSDSSDPSHANGKGKLHKKRQNRKFGKGKGNKEEATFSETWGPQSKCNKHPNGEHAWIDCKLNPRSRNYDAAAADRYYEMLHSNNGNNYNNDNNTNSNNGNNNPRYGYGQGRSGYGGPTHQGHYYHHNGPPNQYYNQHGFYHYQGGFNAPPPPPRGNYNSYHNNMPQSGGHYGQGW